MFPCRFAFKCAAPLVRGSCPVFGHVCRMSSGNVPGSSGNNLFYFAVVGGAVVGAGIYAYRTLSRDAARYNDRVSTLGTRPEVQWVPKPWPLKYYVPSAQELDSIERHVNAETGELEAVHVSTTEQEQVVSSEESEASAQQTEVELVPRAQEGGKTHEEDASWQTAAEEEAVPRELEQVSSAAVVQEEAVPANDWRPKEESISDAVPESLEDSSSAEQVTLSHEPVQSIEVIHSNGRHNEKAISDDPESVEDSSSASTEQVTLSHEPVQSTEENTGSTAA